MNSDRTRNKKPYKETVTRDLNLSLEPCILLTLVVLMRKLLKKEKGGIR